MILSLKQQIPEKTGICCFRLQFSHGTACVPQSLAVTASFTIEVMEFAYQEKKVYHFTTLENLPTILKYGLVSSAEQKRMGLPYRSIAWEALKRYREEFSVPVDPGGLVSDYVSFYFSHLTHMLLVILSNKVVDQDHIIHIEFPIKIMEQYPCVFSDAPIIPGSSPTFYSDANDLRQLDWHAITSPLWQEQNISIRTSRLAELLIYKGLSIDAASRIVAWDNSIAQQVEEIYQSAGKLPPVIETDLTFYFLDEGAGAKKPAIHGPASLYQAYRNTVAAIIEKQQRERHARFRSLSELLIALQSDLRSLPETAELVGLETDNKAHFEDVGTHTRRVVAEILATEEYQRLSQEDQLLTQVAGYLHDIGKGPKVRWSAKGGKQQIDMDHPVKALPMLERILSEEVEDINLFQIETICKLVAYHDLIGGIMVSGRRFEELLQIIGSEGELDMLMAISRGDATAINPGWALPEERQLLREKVLAKLDQHAPG